MRRIRALILGLLPFGLASASYWAVGRLVHLRGAFEVGALHAAELRLFGMRGPSGELRTITSLLQDHLHPALDLLGGAAYIGYALVPLALVVAWSWTGRSLRAQRLAWAFLLVSVAGFATQLAWPAAPPWYFDLYGPGAAVLDAASSPAGAARFDALLGISYFAEFYSRSLNIFGSIPSIHSAYPVLAALACYRLGPWRFVPAAVFALLVGFSALYLNHHYLLDVLAGAAYAGAAYAAVSFAQQRILMRRRQA